LDATCDSQAAYDFVFVGWMGGAGAWNLLNTPTGMFGRCSFKDLCHPKFESKSCKLFAVWFPNAGWLSSTYINI
jgi:hypothetical protein